MYRLLLLILAVMGSWLVGQEVLSPKEKASTPKVTPTSKEHPFPSRRQLQRSAWNTNGWLLLYDGNSTALKQLLGPLQEQSFRGITLAVHPWQEVPDSIQRAYPTILIGTTIPEEVETHLAELPAIDWKEQYLQLGETALEDSTLVAQLSYLPGPWQDTLPMHLLWASSEAPLLKHVEERLARGFRSFLWTSWGYEIIAAGETQFMGYFNDSTWVMDREIHFAFDEKPMESELGEVATFETFDGAEMPDKAWLERLGLAKQQIQVFCETTDLPPIPIKLYPTVERKALRTKFMEQVHLGSHAEAVHIVADDDLQATEWGLPYCVWLRQALGKPKQELLELGLSYQWIDTLRGHSWRSWVRQLAEADALPPAEALLDGRTMRQEYPLIGSLAAGAWVDYQLQTKDRSTFLDYYKQNSSAPNQRSYQDWKAWIRSTYPPFQTTKTTPTPQKLNGFTLAHEGYRIYNGYGGQRAQQSLVAMQQIGIDAVAVVPYSYMANPNRPDPIPVSRQAGAENDEAVLFSHFSAQELGQYTLLKPQIWLGSGSWPGDVNFSSEAEWEQFFTYYKRWIMHYALLGELYGFDGFCIGTELRYTTLRQPDKWRALIQDIRKVYRGDLTYAANWGEECEKLTFWKDLDFIGVNCYYPLHQQDKASEAELARGAERVVQKLEHIHEQADRPIWLTEIGYRSATSAWKSPHAEAERRAVDEQAQAQCYEAILAATYNKDWVGGYFWWKWPCDLSYDEDRGRGYMPLGKPAQQVLARYYLAEQQ
ncbi:MAG: glycosyl hydrolase [Bacteroidota bacterium]